MTQEAMKKMYQLLLTEPHAPTVCAQLERIAREALADHAMQEVQRLGQEIEQVPVVHDPLPRACNLAGVDYQTFLKIKAYMPVVPPHPERHELQAKDEHPAPCARHCEANAFQIVIKNLKAQLAQPEQEPPKYSFKAHWEKDGRIGVVGAIVRPDGGVHLLQDIIDPPQRTWVGLTKEQIAEFDAWHDNREEEVGWVNPSEIVAYIDAKLKQKNGYAEEKNT
jgi:hypothetical protein